MYENTNVNTMEDDRFLSRSAPSHWRAVFVVIDAGKVDDVYYYLATFTCHSISLPLPLPLSSVLHSPIPSRLLVLSHAHSPMFLSL